PRDRLWTGVAREDGCGRTGRPCDAPGGLDRSGGAGPATPRSGSRVSREPRSHPAHVQTRPPPTASSVPLYPDRGGVSRLVTGSVLKTDVTGYPGQAGSIPVRLRWRPVVRRAERGERTRRRQRIA